MQGLQKSAPSMKRANVYMAIVFLVASNLFGLIPVEGIVSLFFSSNVLLFALCFVGAVAVILPRRGGGLKIFGTFFGNYFGYFLFAVTFVALMTIIDYPSSDRLRVFSRWCALLTVFFVFPALAYCERAPRGIVDLLVLFEKIALVGCLLYLLNALAFQVTGKLLLPGQSFLGDYEHANVRYFLVRLSVPQIFDFTTIAAFVLLITNPGKELKLHAATFVVGMCTVVLVAQSRAEIAAVVAAVFVALILRFGHGHPYLSLISAGVCALLVLLITGAFSNILGLFISNGTLERSSMIRSDSTRYYLDVFAQNPLFGFGFITGSPSYYSLEHGFDGLAWVSDVGVFGQIAQWGMLFVIAYALSVARAVYVTVTRWRSSSVRTKCLMAAFLCYMVLTSYSLIILSVNSGLCFPLFVAIYECVLVDNLATPGKA